MPAVRTVTAIASGVVLVAGIASGQNFPSKSIRIVTNTAGSGSDFSARLIAAGLTTSLGQPVVVDNRGSGPLPVVTVVKSTPDGYTLLLQNSSIWLAPLIESNVAYDPVRDLAPITLVSTELQLLMLNGAVPARSVKELIAHAKAHPGQLNYSMASIGGPAQLAAELFKSMAGIDLVRVAYKGSSTVQLADLLSGQVQLSFQNWDVEPHVKAGKLRLLAVTSREPSPMFPGIPTMAFTLPGYESITMAGVFAPAKSPDAIIKRLNQEIVRVLNQPDTRKRLVDSGVSIIGNTPEEFGTTIKSEISKWGKIIKDAGIKAE